MTRTSYGAQHIESKITGLLKPLFKADKKNFIVINNIAKNWEQIVGKKYSKLCAPKSISFAKGRNDEKHAKLTIAVYNASVGFFMQNNSEILLEKIATLYGYKAIHKIIIKQETKEIEGAEREDKKLPAERESEMQKNLVNVKDKDLAETLARLGREIFGEEKS